MWRERRKGRGGLVGWFGWLVIEKLVWLVGERKGEGEDCGLSKYSMWPMYSSYYNT